MKELEELTKGKSLQELFLELKFQLVNGVSLEGEVCSFIINKIESLGGKVYTFEQWSKQQHTDVWTTERDDIKDWERIRHKYMGKKTILGNDNGSTVLNIEGSDFIIV